MAALDYGTTWMQLSAAVTGAGRYQVSSLTISRRFFIVGGYSTGLTASGPQNDVWVAYW